MVFDKLLMGAGWLAAFQVWDAATWTPAQVGRAGGSGSRVKVGVLPPADSLRIRSSHESLQSLLVQCPRIVEFSELSMVPTVPGFGIVPVQI